MKVLVTGGSGFIGSSLMRKLSELGHAVYSLDRETGQGDEDSKFSFRGDICDAEVRKAALTGMDWVYHLAAVISVPYCEAHPEETSKINREATEALFRDFHRYGARDGSGKLTGGFAFSSSAAVYGALSSDAISEESPLKPISHYGWQKADAENTIRKLSSELDVPSICFRFFNVYGPGQLVQSGDVGVVTLFMDRARKGLPLKLNGGGLQTRDLVHVSDVVAACAEATKLNRDVLDGRAVNIASGKSITIKDLAELCKRMTDSASEMPVSPARAGDVLLSTADISRARSLLGFKPRMGLEVGLREFTQLAQRLENKSRVGV
jgi:UDP-glucose 4-epimerase